MNSGPRRSRPSVGRCARSATWLSKAATPLTRPPWTEWTPQATRRRVVDEASGPVELWFQNLEIDGYLVRYDIHYLFARSGEELVSPSELKFRSRTELGRSLLDAGFTVEVVFGDWDGRPADETRVDLRHGTRISSCLSSGCDRRERPIGRLFRPALFFSVP